LFAGVLAMAAVSLPRDATTRRRAYAFARDTLAHAEAEYTQYRLESAELMYRSRATQIWLEYSVTNPARYWDSLAALAAARAAALRAPYPEIEAARRAADTARRALLLANVRLTVTGVFLLGAMGLGRVWWKARRVSAQGASGVRPA
ncbi:MAG TPA: hypothetical protein VE869_00765, partial [Gemmatimonas sp.]|nr:hypothetical protein [Gemmatimonas sp.]